MSGRTRAKEQVVDGQAGNRVVVGGKCEVADHRTGSLKTGGSGLRVSVIEPLGDRQDVTLTTSTGFTLVARIDGASELRDGDDAGFGVDLSRVHLFDRHGARLEPSELVEARP